MTTCAPRRIRGGGVSRQREWREGVVTGMRPYYVAVINSPYYTDALLRHFPALPSAQTVFEVPLHDIEELAGNLRGVL